MRDQTPVRGDNQFLNYAHPAVIGGGILGSFAGSEIGDKAFGGNHLETITKIIKRPISVKRSRKVLGVKIPFTEKLVEETTRNTHHAIPFSTRLGKNVLRGGLGAVGAGLAAYGVRKYRDMQKQASLNHAENDMAFRQQLGLMNMPNMKQIGAVKRFNFMKTAALLWPHLPAQKRPSESGD